MFNPDQQYGVAFRTAVIAGLFSAIVGGLLLSDFRGRVEKDPLNSPEYLALKKQLLKERQNEDLKAQVRDLDLALREKYFRQRQFANWGIWLLLGGIVVTLTSAKWAATLHRKLPKPVLRTTHTDAELRTNRIARWSVAGLAAIAAATIVLLATSLSGTLPKNAQELAQLIPEAPVPDSKLQPNSDPKPEPEESPFESVDSSEKPQPTPKPQPDSPSKEKLNPGKPGGDPKPSTKAKPEKPQTDAGPRPSPVANLPPLPPGFATDDELRKNWPRFRGSMGMGISAHTKIPTQWDATSGEGLAWKTEVPLPGNSSPIVWEKRVFLTGATKDQRQVFCFDADSGKLLWQKDVPGSPESTTAVVKLNDQTGFAASTPATDGRRVYAIFANGDIAAFDFDGNVRWSRSLGIPKNSYGHASSLATFQNLVLVQLDQGTKGENLSRLLALKGETGETAWEVTRDVPNSWPTPLVIQHSGQALVITAAAPWVIANAATDGKEVWRAQRLSGDVGPSPVMANDMIYVANEFPAGSAIRLGGSGDVTKTHVAWEVESGLPDCVTPLVTDKFLFLVTSSGILTCYDALQGGNPLWEKEFDDANFSSSPGMVGNLIYLFAEKGKVFVVEPDEKGCKVVSEPVLGEHCVACPAFQEGRIFVRGKTHLFCIGAK